MPAKIYNSFHLSPSKELLMCKISAKKVLDPGRPNVWYMPGAVGADRRGDDAEKPGSHHGIKSQVWPDSRSDAEAGTHEAKIKRAFRAIFHPAPRENPVITVLRNSAPSSRE
jgi:hypothetical protein